MDDAFFRLILDHVADGVYFVDRDRRILYWNKAAETLTGYFADEVVGRGCQDGILCHVDGEGVDQCADNCPLTGTMEDGQPRQVDMFLRHKQGHRVPVRVKSEALRDEQGHVIGSVAVFTDNSVHVACLEQVEDLTRETLHDPLTGVGNRRYAEITLNSRLDEAQRYNWPFGVLFLDIDHFKDVNDIHGHDVGDAMLQAVANTLAANVRSFDFVGRWGGEEFIYTVFNATEDHVSRVADTIRENVLSLNIQNGFPSTDEYLSVSIGIGTVKVENEQDVRKCIRLADKYLYQAKSCGRNCIKGPGSDYYSSHNKFIYKMESDEKSEIDGIS